MTAEQLNELAKTMRVELLETIHNAKTCHVGVVLSEVEILIALYFGGVLKIDPQNPNWPDRDRFILSKGHGCLGLYLTLAKRGFMSAEEMKENHCRDGTGFIAQLNSYAMPGVEVSTGALGHGLGVGVGMALAGKMDKKDYRIFVLLGDGELDEGSCWESMLHATHHGLDNLTAIVDRNGLQAYGKTEEVLRLEPLTEKWRAFNWSVKVVNGHNISQLTAALNQVPFEKGRPSVVIAKTVKGKGVSFAENQVRWHYKTPSAEEVLAAKKEILGGAR